jgi:hypothetical protein
VLDHLPRYLSSVYLFSDPDLPFLSLGTYSALQEIAYARAHGFAWYCLGLYVEPCAKMQYKRRFEPCELLLPRAVAAAAAAAAAAPAAAAATSATTPVPVAVPDAAGGLDTVTFSWLEASAALLPLRDRALYRARAPDRMGVPPVPLGPSLAACLVVVGRLTGVAPLGRLAPAAGGAAATHAAALRPSAQGALLANARTLYALLGMALAQRAIVALS